MIAGKRILLIILAAISSLFISDSVFASPLINLNSEQTQYNLSPQIEILEDKNHDITLDEINEGQYDDAFFLFEGDIPSFGYTTSAYWAKVTIENNAANEEWYLQLAYPPLDIVRLYTPTDDGTFILRETGDLFPFASREVPHRDFVFPLDLPEGSSQTFYLHIITEGSMQIPLTLSDGITFHTKSLSEYLILGIYYGFGLIMILYNLFLFFSLRLTSYFWYALLILFILGTHSTLNGLSYQYIWPNASWWNNRGILFFMTGANTIVLQFTKSFLNTKTYTPRINNMINWGIVFQIILLLVLFVNYEIALNLIMVVMILLVILVASSAIFSWVNGVEPAKYLFFGWIIFLIGITISSLADMGMIPITFLTKYASQIGSGVEITLFSLALGSKIKWLRLEKEALERQAMQSQQLAIKHLQQANQMKDEFLANTSHELRTPLQGIIGIAESLQERKGLDKKWNYNLSLIISSGEKLSHLINDLLDASKLKFHELSLDIEPIQLWKLTELVCQVSSATSQKPIVIKNKISEDLPLLAADEARLQQILYNLLSNALKYTDKGEIVLTAEEMENDIVVSIRDTGIGISKEDIHVIFDSFQRGSNIDDISVSGTGLGLTITKQLVDLHGGEISITSSPNEGTTVFFTVPIYKKKVTKAIHTAQQSALVVDERYWDPVNMNKWLNPVPEKTSGKILLADDEAINIHVLYNHLTFAGYEVIIAYDGEQAVDKLRAHDDFDLVILDVMLPRFSGFLVAKNIRETYSITELPILMLTARSQTEDIITAFNAGANDYLTKPCSKEELLARVRTLLSLKLVMEQVTTVNRELQDLNQSLEKQVQIRTAELENSTKKLEQTNVARKKLMTNISHELGTPMTSIKGYVKAMLDGVIASNDQKYIELVYQKILFIERLIQDLYGLARLESRQLGFTWKNMSVKDFLSELISQYEIDVTAKNIEYIYENKVTMEDGSKRLMVDINRIEQVMQNLIFNAIRYTSADGFIQIKANIHNHLPEQNGSINYTDFLQISVCDNGTGIHQETLPHVFERFYQEDKFSKGSSMNTGLGLTIAKEIIHYHNGSLWVESEYGKGSCFHFLLPLNTEKNKGGS